ncbi:MAG: PKD domain-containing protein [Patescibacteria group bacterium]
MKIILLIFVALFLPSLANARADLSIDAGDIRFSQQTLTAGDQVRIYASIDNFGDEDVSGYVTFYQGATLIGDSLVISVLASGSAEEVYVDFIVPSSKFNIQAQVRGTDPVDVDETNNTAITGIFSPIMDDDRDHVENASDNCSRVSNPDQLDTDADGAGDACDSDDDNDELSDEVERELGTSTTTIDTDGDGVEDQSDAFPTDPELVSEEDVVDPGFSLGATENSEEETNTSVTFKEIISQVAETIQGSTSDESLQTESENQILPSITFSPNAIFSYTRESWNTFTFTTIAPVDNGISVRWDFGDGVTSSKNTVSHTFGVPGSYTVKLDSASGESTASTEQTTILVPFFSLQNPVVLVAIVGLSLILLVALALVRSNILPRHKRARNIHTSEQD